MRMRKPEKDNLREVYVKKALPQIPRVLSLEDRNELSSTFGCFDRTYWLDKAIDFPTALAQFSVHSLALVYAHKFPNNIYFQNEKIKKWCIAGMDFWTKIQKSDGSFDEFYPNEHGWAGPTGFILYAVLDSYRLLERDIPCEISDRILEAAHKAAKYLAKYDEQGILANHHALAILAIYITYKTTGDEHFLEGFKDKLDYFMTLQSPEGWSLEYDGADIGYLSATISFLGKLYKLTNDGDLKAQILEIVEKAIDFSSYFVYPNKFYAGTIGSRQTLHFYPHGYEIFGRDIPLAGSIADEMLEGLQEEKLVPPEIMPDRYFMFRISEFFQAYLDYGIRASEQPKLPYEKEPFNRYFDGARIYVAKKPEYYIIVNLDKGGVIKVFDITSQRLVYNDCGIIGRLSSGKLVSSQWVDKTYKTNVEDGKIEINGNLHEIPSRLPTPFNMILFRLTLLTLGWNTKLAYWLKGRIRQMLITGSKAVPIEFKRIIENSKDYIDVQDTIKLLNKGSFKSLMIGDEFSVRFVPQSLYFQSQELGISGFQFDNDLLEKLNENRAIMIQRKIYPEKSSVDYTVM